MWASTAAVHHFVAQLQLYFFLQLSQFLPKNEPPFLNKIFFNHGRLLQLEHRLNRHDTPFYRHAFTPSASQRYRSIYSAAGKHVHHTRTRGITNASRQNCWDVLTTIHGTPPLQNLSPLEVLDTPRNEMLENAISPCTVKFDSIRSQVVRHAAFLDEQQFLLGCVSPHPRQLRLATGTGYTNHLQQLIFQLNCANALL